MPTPRDLDLVLFGATGFTGRLVAEHLATARERVRWAIAGRDRDKLEALRLDVPTIVADATDPVAMRSLAARTRVVCTTVGPYAKYGSELVAACAHEGTHYCDLAGEPLWMRRMIDENHDLAARTGARIVSSCGYDAIPSDLGTWALQQEMSSRFGRPASRVTALFGETSGTVSGGTIASALETARTLAADRGARRLVANPYALDPDPRAERPPAPDERGITWEPHLRMFTTPFLMSGINTRVVRRSHALAGFPWGGDFVYREVMSTPGTPRGLVRAVATTAALGALAYTIRRPWLRDRLARRVPQPGQGPSSARRERGHWKVRFVGELDGQHLVYEAGDAHGDPGYASTAKMIGQSALSLALDPLSSGGGVITPSIAMGSFLLERLRRSGLSFAVAG